MVAGRSSFSGQPSSATRLARWLSRPNESVRLRLAIFHRVVPGPGGRATVNKFLNHACEIPSRQYDGGQHAMDNLPTWAVWIAAPAVGVALGLAILWALRIARLLYGLLSPRPSVASEPQI